MAYIHSSMYSKIKRAIKIADESSPYDLLALAKRHVKDTIDITTVLGHAIIVEGSSVFLELEYEYFTMEDTCLINTVTIEITHV